jgi:hypothetical protein
VSYAQFGRRFFGDFLVAGQESYPPAGAGPGGLQRTGEAERAPWFCPKADTPPIHCQRYPGKDAYSLGIVTGPGTVAIALPQSMQPALTFFGRRLPEPHDKIRVFLCGA